MPKKRIKITNDNNHQFSSEQPKFFKKFGEEQNLNKSQIQFTLEEKRNFLKACQENGLNVIYDIKKIQQYLPSRSETEIKFLIDVYERKAKTRKEESQDKCKDTPIELWNSLCDHLVRSQSKREDSSMCLINLMEKYSDESPKFSKIYNYLKELMEAKYPTKLSTYDAIVFLSLIKNLSNLVQNQDLTAEKDYILNLYEKLEKKLEQENNYKTVVDEFEYLNYFEKIDPTDQSSGTNQETSLSTNKDNPVYYYSKLPKIKLIQECLNPLGISVEVQKDLHSLITLNGLISQNDN